MKNVLVTGASGYIGGQTAIALHDAGYRVIGIDRFERKHLRDYFHRFVSCDFGSEEAQSIIKQHRPAAIIHCAGTSLVGPSIKNPQLYYENNFVKTKKLIDFLVHSDLDTRFIFSSSAATYGEPIITPIQEIDPQQPINPDGQSKLMVEMMLESYALAYGLDYVGFRYFNVCGADSQGRHGQAPEATHIIARILESLRDNKNIVINGKEYSTPDGTCIRDYVHVEDVAQAHLLAIQHGESGFYNIGTGTGYSNKEIVDTALSVTGTEKQVTFGPMREGDPAVLTGSADKLSDATGWQPQHNLQTIIKTAWKWYNREL